MMRPMTVLALATALAAAGCGGARKESRERKQESTRAEQRTGDHAQSAGGAHRNEAAPSSGAGGGAHGGGEAREGRETQAGTGPGGNEPRVAASPEALLGRDTVTKVQRALGQRGLLTQHQQGELDAPTREAVRRFQQQQGLATTGMPDRETLRDLGINAEEAYAPQKGGKG
jgi:hypothetical protein